ncbi:nicotinate-nucleotide--dimethylbenzimidazole phosphoribosyltransferase [Streptomyces sp. NPDC087658]|uniref:nicotinate-nucleotide--dimethylbenzimidazole phosphoribosyltransferase n=1 Tax=Streptomyces sp. NPDC087658 TaxID=3365800 RepID=UPI00382677C1
MTDTGQVPGEGLPENAGMVEQPAVPAAGTYTYLDSPRPATEDEDILLMPSAQGGWNDPQVVPADYAPPVGYAIPEGYAVPAGYAPEGYAAPEQAGVQQQMEQAPPIEQPVPQAPEAYEPPQEYPAEVYLAETPVEQPAVPVEEAAAQQPGAHETGGRDTGSVDLNGVRVPPPAAAQAAPAPAPRRPLHLGPQVPDPTGGVVRSLADRGPAEAPAQPVRTRARAQAPAVAGPEYLDAAQAPQQQADIPPQAGAPWAAEAEAPAETAAPDPQPEPEQPPAPQPVAVVKVPEYSDPVSVPPTGEFAAPDPEEPPAPEPEPEQTAPAPAPEAEPAPAQEAPAEPAPAPAPEPEQPAQEAPAEPSAPEPEQTAPEPAPEPEQAPEPVPAQETQEAQEEPPAEEPEQEVAPAPEPEPEPEQTAPAPAPETEAEPAPAQEAPTEPAPAPEPEQPAQEAPAEPPAPEPERTQQLEQAPEPEQEQQPEQEEHQQHHPEQHHPEQEQEPESAAAPSGYDDAEREAVFRVMRERRDVRNGFRPDPIPNEVLLRVLEAAHTAPSVGHSQPWDFVVIRSAETRRSMHELAQRQREAYAKSLPKGRAKQFKELKIEAILDTPVNIVVTADPTRGGRHTLGRHTQPQMAPYSSALAVENFWLAARAEGLGVGWVSFFDEREMVRALGLPEHLDVVAYLCVGYVDEFPEEPELMQAGWSKRRPLSWVVHEETYGRRALPGEEPHNLLQETIAGIRPLDAKALGEAWERQKRMTKPAGALGMLEIISAQLSGLSRVCPPPIPEPAAVAIFAGDHGVHAQGVTPWPQEVTAQMVANFLGGGAVCNAFAGQVGAEVCVVDVGVAAELPATQGLLPRKVRAGTSDFTTGPALTREEVLAAIEVGIETARDLVTAGNKALLTGEMGIANTTVSAALICVYTGQDAAEITGRGTGINDETHARKIDVVRRGLELHRPDPADPIGVLAAVGGLEHAALVGFLLGGASMRTPVILDGVSAGAAALVARAIAPEALAACIAGHRSAEPGHVAALNKLGLRPLVDLDLRLGEGTGALLALPVIQSAARAMREVATFDSAGVTEK